MSHDDPHMPICRYTYVLRVWREGVGQPWRLAVREANAASTIGLADLDELVLFLLRQMEGRLDPATDGEITDAT